MCNDPSCSNNSCDCTHAGCECIDVMPNSRQHIYIVAEHSLDISQRFMDMRGAFKSEIEAKKHREYLFEKYKINTEVMKFVLLDTIED